MKTFSAHVNEVCKIGQGELCCRYLLCGPDGLECGKLNPEMKSTIDKIADTMGSKGDNCEGKIGLS